MATPFYDKTEMIRKMIKMNVFAKKSIAAATVCLLLCTSSAMAGQDKPPETPTKPAPNPKWDAKSMDVLRKSIEYVTNLKGFTTTLYHKATMDGGAKRKKKEEVYRYDIAVEQPNKVALAVGEGKLHCAIYSDGGTFWAYVPANKSYVERKAPKSVASLFELDEIGIANQDLQNLLFIDQYYMQGAYDKLMDGVLELQYVGLEQIAQEKVHHLKFLQENFDWHLWIQDGDKPVLRRVSIDAAQMMKDEQGPIEVALSFVSQFDNWIVNEPIPSKTFVFIPPPETKKVSSFFKNDDNYDPKLLGIPAPDLTAKLLDGTTFNLAEQKGKNIVVLDFWATWCGPCRAAMPGFSEVMEAYKGKGVIGFAVNLKEAPELVAEFQKKTPKLTMPILLDADGKIAQAYRVQPIPMSVIVGKDGVIQAVHMGIPGGKVEVLKSKLTAELDALLAGQPLPK